MKKNIGFILSIFTFAFLFSMASVMACSCISPRDVQTELNESYAVFQGRVIDIDEETFNDGYTVEVYVEKSWKTVQPGMIEVRTADNSAACGYPFQVNATYLIYASYSEKDIHVYSCGRTAPLADAQQDIVELGEPLYSSESESPEPRMSLFEKIRDWISSLFN